MNDFTKEELMCMRKAIENELYKIPMSNLNSQRRRELLDKLNSLIDNYCEHDYVTMNKEVSHIQCVKCGINK